MQTTAAISRITYVAVIIAITTAYFLYALWTPLMQDDLVFQAQSLDPTDPASGFSIAGWWNHIVINWIEDNSRLANIIAPLGSMLLPQWARAAIIAIQTAACFILLDMMTRPRGTGRATPTGDGTAIASIWLVSLVAWPWRDRIVLWVYSLNYITAILLSLIFIYTFSRCGNDNDRASRPQPPLLIVALGAAIAIGAGWFHNGISAPLVAATGCWCLWNRFNLSQAQWILGVCLLAGGILAHLSPAIWMRAQQEAANQNFLNNLILSVKNMPLAWISVISLCAMALKAKGRTTLKTLFADGTFFIPAFYAAIALAMNLCLEISPRYGWGAEVMATLPIWRMCRQKPSATAPCQSAAATLILLIAVAIPMHAILSTQHRLWIENAEIENEIKESPHGTIFRDITTHDDIPKTTLKQTTAGIWANAFQQSCYNSHGMDGDKMAAIVPAALKNLDFDAAIPLEGSAGVCLWNRFLVSTDTIAPFPPQQGFPSGRQRHINAELLLETRSGDKITWVTGIYKFNPASDKSHTAVYWGQPPFGTPADPLVKVDRLK